MKFPSDQGFEVISSEVILLEAQQIRVVTTSKERVKVFILQGKRGCITGIFFKNHRLTFLDRKNQKFIISHNV